MTSPAAAALALQRMATQASPKVRRAFLTAVGDVVEGTDEDELAAALEAGDMAGALETIPWGQVWVPTLTEELPPTLAALTLRAAGHAVRAAVEQFELDMDDVDPIALVTERATAWAAQHGAAKIVELTSQARGTIQAVLVRGIQAGQAPAALARQLRGLIGLTEQQAGAVQTFEAGLEAAGDAKAAAKAGRYAQSLLRYRANNIARTESLTAANAGEEQAWQGLQAEGILPATQEQEWMTTGGRVCDLCQPMDGQRAAVGAVFTRGDGVPIFYPPAHPSCRCSRRLVLA